MAWRRRGGGAGGRRRERVRGRRRAWASASARATVWFGSLSRTNMSSTAWWIAWERAARGMRFWRLPSAVVRRSTGATTTATTRLRRARRRTAACRRIVVNRRQSRARCLPASAAALAGARERERGRDQGGRGRGARHGGGERGRDARGRGVRAGARAAERDARAGHGKGARRPVVLFVIFTRQHATRRHARQLSETLAPATDKMRRTRAPAACERRGRSSLGVFVLVVVRGSSSVSFPRRLGSAPPRFVVVGELFVCDEHRAVDRLTDD